MSSSAPRTLLRNATSGLHLASERRWQGGAGFGDRVTYRAFLRVSLAAHRGLGLPAAKRRGGIPEISEEFARIAALYNDLGAPLPDTPTQPIPSLDYAWGVGYALNGAALGAAILLKQGRIAPDWSDAYLRCGQAFARRGGPRGFFRALDAAQPDPGAALAGARAVFALYAAPYGDMDSTDATCMAHPREA